METLSKCDCGDAEAAGCYGMCAWCYAEAMAPWPAPEWPAGVAWEDLASEWTDYFTSLAFDWPPLHCGVVVALTSGPRVDTWADCTTCGMRIG